MTTSDQTVCQDLGKYIDASPSPYHAVHNAATKLQAAGFVEVAETDAWTDGARSGYFRRGGSLVAWRLGSDAGAGFRVIGVSRRNVPETFFRGLANGALTLSLRDWKLRIEMTACNRQDSRDGNESSDHRVPPVRDR